MNEVIVLLLKGSWFEGLFFCPGCGNAHGFRQKDWPVPDGFDQMSNEDKKLFQEKWIWNGNKLKPTLRPSVRIERTVTDDAGIAIMDANNKPRKETICHLIMTDGKIQYLGDCKHKLKGQTIDMVAL